MQNRQSGTPCEGLDPKAIDAMQKVWPLVDRDLLCEVIRAYLDASPSGSDNHAGLVARLREVSHGDHQRGCEGRCYTCSCGYDDKILSVAAEAIAALSRAPEAVETGWLIEHGSTSTPMYWTGEWGRWSGLHSEACRFARREDAFKVALGLGDASKRVDHRIVEHAWNGSNPATTPAPQPIGSDTWLTADDLYWLGDAIGILRANGTETHASRCQAILDKLAAARPKAGSDQ